MRLGEEGQGRAPASSHNWHVVHLRVCVCKLNSRVIQRRHSHQASLHAQACDRRRHAEQGVRVRAARDHAGRAKRKDSGGAGCRIRQILHMPSLACTERHGRKTSGTHRAPAHTWKKPPSSTRSPRKRSGAVCARVGGASGAGGKSHVSRETAASTSAAVMAFSLPLVLAACRSPCPSSAGVSPELGAFSAATRLSRRRVRKASSCAVGGTFSVAALACFSRQCLQPLTCSAWAARASGFTVKSMSCSVDS
jgi:hypothetical protein